MNIEEIRELCIAVHPNVTEDIPFGEFGSEDVAFRIAGKIFAFLLVDDSRMVVLKCDPGKALELREEFPGIIEAAFHWNKKYWNQVHYDSLKINQDIIKRLITHSFEEVVKKLPKKIKEENSL